MVRQSKERSGEQSDDELTFPFVGKGKEGADQGEIGRFAVLGLPRTVEQLQEMAESLAGLESRVGELKRAS